MENKFPRDSVGSIRDISWSFQLDCSVFLLLEKRKKFSNALTNGKVRRRM